MYARNSNIIESYDLVAQNLGGYRGLFRHGYVCCSACCHNYTPYSVGLRQRSYIAATSNFAEVEVIKALAEKLCRFVAHSGD